MLPAPALALARRLVPSPATAARAATSLLILAARRIRRSRRRVRLASARRECERSPLRQRLAVATTTAATATRDHRNRAWGEELHGAAADNRHPAAAQGLMVKWLRQHLLLGGDLRHDIHDGAPDGRPAAAAARHSHIARVLHLHGLLPHHRLLLRGG